MQLANRVKDVLFSQDPFLDQHLDQRCGLPHIGEGQFFKGDDFLRVKRLGHDSGEDTRMGDCAKGEENSPLDRRKAKSWSPGKKGSSF